MAVKIIVVDDSRTVRLQVCSVLIPAGFEVIEAGDGVEGAQKVAQYPDAKVVICDLNMPNLDGLGMLAAVKQGGQNADMRFLMLTTEARPTLVQQAKAGGASGWIIKPFKPDLLLAAVRKMAG